MRETSDLPSNASTFSEAKAILNFVYEHPANVDHVGASASGAQLIITFKGLEKSNLRISIRPGKMLQAVQLLDGIMREGHAGSRPGDDAAMYFYEWIQVPA